VQERMLGPIEGLNNEEVAIISRMAPKNGYGSAIMASIHETAEGLHATGLLSKRAMSEFDECCLTRVRPIETSTGQERRPKRAAVPANMSSAADRSTITSARRNVCCRKSPACPNHGRPARSLRQTLHTRPPNCRQLAIYLSRWT